MLEISNFDNEIYEYYKIHFILFRDLGPILGIEQEQLQQYLPANQTEWESILKIDEQRKVIIMNAINLIEEKSQILKQVLTIKKYQRKFDATNTKDKLIQEIQFQKLDSILTAQIPRIERLIRAARFISLYLYQDNYDVNELNSLLQVPYSTSKKYFQSDVISILINDDKIRNYIKLKRKISLKLAGEKGSQHYIENQSYDNKERNEKGQFVKKYQASEAIK